MEANRFTNLSFENKLEMREVVEEQMHRAADYYFQTQELWAEIMNALKDDKSGM